VNRAARAVLLGDILPMSFETLRANPLRSSLTVLGVVIGVTSIVAMTAMIRGFGDQMRAAIQQMGTDTVVIQKGASHLAAGPHLWDLMKRPNLTEADALAIAELPSAGAVSYQLGGGGPGSVSARFTYGNTSTRPMAVVGGDVKWPQTNFLKLAHGRFFSEFEVDHRRRVILLGHAPASVLFPHSDPVGKVIRFGRHHYQVVGVFEKRPSVLGDNGDQFGLIPSSTYVKQYPAHRVRGFLMRPLMIFVLPRVGVPREQLMEDVESVLRARHRLRLDERNDFEVLTADSMIRLVEQLTRAVALALVVISSIALAVGGVGVMAVMSISVTERTREIGVRKAVGATRAAVLWQFLVEALVVTSTGGLIGAVLGAGVGLTVNIAAGLPLALPWWAFVLGIGFSSGVGLLFGILPAVKASRLDPVEALRYE